MLPRHLASAALIALLGGCTNDASTAAKTPTPTPAPAAKAPAPASPLADPVTAPPPEATALDLDAWVVRPFDQETRDAVREALRGIWVIEGTWLRGGVERHALALDLRDDAIVVYDGHETYRARLEVVAPCKIGIAEALPDGGEVTNYHAIAFDGARLFAGRGGLVRGARMAACDYETYLVDGPRCTKHVVGPMPVPCRLDGEGDARALVVDDPERGQVTFAVQGGLLRHPFHVDGTSPPTGDGAPLPTFEAARARVDAINEAAR
ncbi:MAG: hypothetical protein H6711_18290 [Myxococcales bacterium]|nr:hypothetical protein [Myxococcales bacterium]